MREWDDWSRKRKKQNETDQHEKQSDGKGPSNPKDTSRYTDGNVAEGLVSAVEVVMVGFYGADVTASWRRRERDLLWSLTAEMRLAKPDGEPGDGSEDGMS